jgi:UDP-N-acetylmuramyl pentapeptide synthase
MKSVLTNILALLAKLYLWRYRPVIVGVTGSAGKTTTKLAIAAVLETARRVRASGGNMNTELGIPAAVIGDVADRYYRSGGSVLFWLGVVAQGLVGWLHPRSSYPEVLVLEYGADRPGDIARLVAIVPPTVGVVTRVGDIPVHVEFFASPQHVAREKAALVKAVPPNGLIVLNADDLTVLEMRTEAPSAVTTFGFGPGARVHIEGFVAAMDGITFNLTDHATMPVRIRGTISKGAALAAAAAVAVGQHFGIGLAQAAESLSAMRMPPGRMRILPGVKNTTIIDDTYNASPAAMHLALDSVRDLPGRKVAVLGDMKELGEHSPKAHQEIGTMAAMVASVLVCVGEGGRLMREAAANQLPPERLFWFGDSRQAAPEVQRLLRAGDVVLVKGSQSMRMERVVREIMAEPQRASELLVRQSAKWLAEP